MKKYLLSFTLVLTTAFLISSCGEPAPDPNIAIQEAEFAKVMIGHDEVMPKTGQLSKLSRQMKKYMKENPDLDAETKGSVANMISKLMVAEEMMFAWMANIKQLKELRLNKSHEEIMTYLESENEIMINVKKSTNEGLLEGKKLWESLQPQ
jgi:hypothetical protein